MPSSRPANDASRSAERREVAGDEREQALAEEVDPARAGPRRPREARSRRSAARRARPGPGRGRWPRPAVRSRSAPSSPASGPRTRGAPSRPASVASGHVAVEPVVADARRADRVQSRKYSSRNRANAASKPVTRVRRPWRSRSSREVPAAGPVALDPDDRAAAVVRVERRGRLADIAGGDPPDGRAVRDDPPRARSRGARSRGTGTRAPRRRSSPAARAAMWPSLTSWLPSASVNPPSSQTNQIGESSTLPSWRIVARVARCGSSSRPSRSSMVRSRFIDRHRSAPRATTIRACQRRRGSSRSCSRDAGPPGAAGGAPSRRPAPRRHSTRAGRGRPDDHGRAGRARACGDWLEAPRWRTSEAGTGAPVRDHRPGDRPRGRQQPLHVDRAGAQAPRDRLDVDRRRRTSGPAVNREAKLLQLTHAFETLEANRVEFKTHARNERSRNALAGIGATFEGVFRHHMIMPDGSLRDSAWFSIVAPEWPTGEGAAPAGLGLSGSETPRPADLLIVDGRVFQAYGPRDLAPYGSDIGPRPVAAPNAVAVAAGRSPGSGGWTRVAATGRGRGPGSSRRGAASSRPASTMPTSTSSSGAEELDHVDLFQLPTVEAIQDAIARARGGEPGRRLGPGPRLDVRPVPRRPADARAARCGRSRTGRRSWAATTATPAGSNTAALRAAGIDRDTPDPCGRRDRPRPRRPARPTGVLKEGAQELVERVIPRPTTDDDPRCDAAGRSPAMHRMGITAVQDAGGRTRRGRALADAPRRRLAAAPDPPRAARCDPDQHARGLADARSTSTRRSSATCAAATGSTPGSSRASPTASSRRGRRRCSRRTSTTTRPAAPSGSPTSSTRSSPRRTGAAGRSRSTPSAMAGSGWRSMRSSGSGIGPRRASAGIASSTSRPSTAPTSAGSASSGVVASMQPYHADPSPNQIDLWAGNIGPDRASRAWAWQSIRREGGVIALGSDWPVVPFDPFRALNSAVQPPDDGGPARPAAGCRARSCRSPMPWRPTATAPRTRRTPRPARDDQGGDGCGSHRARPRYPRRRARVDHRDRGSRSPSSAARSSIASEDVA